jgi:AcrR family transcriptional regulator
VPEREPERVPERAAWPDPSPPSSPEPKPREALPNPREALSNPRAALPNPREALLDDVVTYAQAHGLQDVSLRALAAAIGTSHRMLIYHFGSRDGVLAAVVDRVEAGQRDALAALAAGAERDPVAVTRRMWAALAEESMHESERLFFDVVALALRGRPGTERLRENLVEPWLSSGADAASALGLSPQLARAEARLGMALLRGLLLDLLVTGDRAGVDEALELFLSRASSTP